jgi:hypothetical protein
MKWKMSDLQTRLYLATVIILLVGLGSAMLIYLTAKNDLDSALGYESVDGTVYPTNPEDSKRYMHDLELYGGKANVLVNELRSWFVGLWHGKSLAFTIACITLVISSGFFFAARHLPSDLEENNQRGNT